MKFIKELDEAVFKTINHSSGISSIDFFMVLISSSEFWIATLGALIVYFLVKKRFSAVSATLFALLALGLSDLISFEVVKPLVMRERPCWILDGVKMVTGRCGGSYGFTSNHAANAGAMVVGLFLSGRFSRKFYIVCIAAAILVGYSRVYLGVHFPGDVLGGFVLGGCIALALYKVRLLALCDFLFTKVLKTPSF